MSDEHSTPTIYDQDDEQKLHEFVFTFGSGHYDVNGRSLQHNYVVVEAEDWHEARRLMVIVYGHKWSWQYTSRETAGVYKYGLEEVPF